MDYISTGQRNIIMSVSGRVIQHFIVAFVLLALLNVPAYSGGFGKGATGNGVSAPKMDAPARIDTGTAPTYSAGYSASNSHSYPYDAGSTTSQITSNMTVNSPSVSFAGAGRGSLATTASGTSGIGQGSFATTGSAANAAGSGQGSLANVTTASPNTAAFGNNTTLPPAKATNQVHKNSLSYKGETHVYAVRSPDGSINKIGESAQGVRVGDGASKRAEQQVRQSNREVGPGHTAEIRKTFPDKRTARTYETNLIERYRRMYGQDSLPGNLTNR